jgi:hypothetical protein
VRDGRPQLRPAPVVQVVGEVEVGVDAPGQRVVEPRVEVPAVRVELLVAATELGEPLVVLVADEQPGECQAAEPLRLSPALRRDPAPTRDGEQGVEIAVLERDLLAGQDRDGDRDPRRLDRKRSAQQEAEIDVTVAAAAEEEKPGPPDVPQRALAGR